MAQLTSNILDGRAGIDHIPAMPLWVVIIRIFQAVLAIIILALTAFADHVLNSLNSYVDSYLNFTFSGYGMSFFIFSWTLLFLAYVGCSAAFAPNLYNKWIHLAAEVLTVIFWLATWALLASEASAFITSYTLDGITIDLESYYPSNWKAAIDCTKASAGLGALEWVLFIITLVFFGISIYRTRTTNLVDAAPAAAPMTEEIKMNPMTYAEQPVVQDPRYGGQQMA